MNSQIPSTQHLPAREAAAAVNAAAAGNAPNQSAEPIPNALAGYSLDVHETEPLTLRKIDRSGNVVSEQTYQTRTPTYAEHVELAGRLRRSIGSGGDPQQKAHLVAGLSLFLVPADAERFVHEQSMNTVTKIARKGLAGINEAIEDQGIGAASTNPDYQFGQI